MDEAQKNQILEERGQKMYDMLCDVLDNSDAMCNRQDEKRLIDYKLPDDDMPMEYRVFVDARRSLLVWYGPLPCHFEEDNMTDGVIATTMINQRLASGSFDLNLENGRVCFRQTSGYFDSMVTPETIRYMLAYGEKQISHYSDQLFMLSKKMVDLEKFSKSLEAVDDQPAPMDEKSIKLSQSTYDQLLVAIEKHGWSCKSNPEELEITYSVNGDDLPMEFAIRVMRDRPMIAIYSPLPLKIPGDLMVDAMTALAYVNDRVIDGYFEIDMSTGRIEYRQTIIYKGSLLAQEAYEYLFDYSTYLVDNYNEKLLMLAKSMLNLKEFIEEIEKM